MTHQQASATSIIVNGETNNKAATEENRLTARLKAASESYVLKKYIDDVKRKHQLDPDYAKWDLNQPLPKLPVPELHQSLEKYLKCLMPIVSDDTYNRINQVAKEFGKPGGVGEELQNRLRQVAEEKDNWAYEWWLNDMYLLNKLPLPINSNPGMMYPRECFPDQDAQLRYAARLISGIMDYKIYIDEKQLPVDRLTCREKGQPLCMEQYYRLFTSYRSPGEHCDSLIDCRSSQLLEPEHVIVICHDQMYVLDVIVNFTRLSDDQLFHQLKRIISQCEEERQKQEANSAVGVLTSLPRDEWARARQELVKDPVNKESLEKIERCIFILCLDRQVKNNTLINNNDDERYIDKEMTIGALQMVHGGGSLSNSCNRWFDKTVQFVVSEDGYCGLNYEHSPAEAIVLIELSEHLFRYLDEKKKQKFYRMPSLCELSAPRKLKWNLSSSTLSSIEYAKLKLDKSIDDLDMRVYKYTKFGRDFPKKAKMSPDSFVQLAMQLAYYKIYKRLVATYESASLRRFRQGRVDNIRANSGDALAWVKAMSPESNITNEEKFRLFKKAVQYQTDLMIDNILGKGMDCHLLALKQIAIESGMQPPELFADETYALSNHFALSTSQVPTSMEGSLICYGAVVPDGYGCSYNPKPDYILFVISAFKSCPTTDTKLFAQSLESSLDEMGSLCAEFIN